ncbi:MAG: aminotransferase class V-fold PLP-dependent enzyme [Gemmatimonadales bacterium]
MSSSGSYAPALERAFEHALAYLGGLDEVPVASTVTLEELRERLTHPLTDVGTDAADVIDQLAADMEGGLTGSGGGRFFAWVIGGAVPAALAADWLTSAWDQNAGLYACAPAAAVAEEISGTWLKDLLGLPTTASFAFVTGCQMAHVTCLAAARNALLAARGWDVEKRGLFGAPALRILGAGERHGTVQRAARFLGLGTDCLLDVPVDTQGRLTASELERALEQTDKHPTVVLLQAGNIDTGIFDSFEELVPIAREHDAWVHVDGAFGLWVAANPAYRHLVAGVERADSWACDGHKWLNVPYDSGYAFVADAAAHRASMSTRASYLTHSDDARDQMDWNPEHSRRARGIATYAAIRQLGRSGIADLVERCCRHASNLVAGIGKLPGAEVLWAPIINQGLVRFVDPRNGASDIDHDRRTDAVIEALLADGEAFFSGTTWRGKRCMRVSVCSWLTRESDVERTVATVKSCLDEGLRRG